MVLGVSNPITLQDRMSWSGYSKTLPQDDLCLQQVLASPESCNKLARLHTVSPLLLVRFSGEGWPVRKDKHPQSYLSHKDDMT